MLSCLGVGKSYTYAVVPVSMLQDRLLKGLHRQRKTIRVLQDVSLAVAPGEWLGIVGPNGCGKTTLAKILAGLMRPDEGEVNRRGRISCFFELGVGFHPERCADENVYLHGLLHGLSAREVRERTDEIVEFAGLQDLRDMPLKCYSTGMRMRLGFAAAMHTDADVLLLDEVIAVGDLPYKEQCRARLCEMKAAGKTAVVAGHNLGELALVCDRIVTIVDAGLRPVEGFTPAGSLAGAGAAASGAARIG